jgi:hypothetical protein
VTSIPLYEVSPGEEMKIQLFGRCPCGAKLDRSETESEELGSISLMRLVEKAMEEAREACCQICGSLAKEATMIVCYRMPGYGPFIAAEVKCSEPNDVALSLRNRLPSAPQDGFIAPLASSSELEAVTRLGSPISVRAAWHEAFMQIQMGFMERSFHAGPGLRMIATTDAGREKHFDLGRIPAFRERLSEDYLSQIDEGSFYCFATIDTDAAADVVKDMGSHYGLEVVQVGPEDLVITRLNGEFAVGLDLRELLVQAAAHHLTLRAVADPALAYTAARLIAAEETKLMIETSFEVTGSIDEGHLVFESKHGKAPFDIDTYVEGTGDDRDAMLTHLRMKLGLGL